MKSKSWGRLCLQAAKILIKYADDPEAVEMHNRLQKYENEINKTKRKKRK